VIGQGRRDEWTVVTADRLITGTDAGPIERGVVLIRGDEIQAVGRQGEITLPDGPAVETFPAGPGQTVMPGMVDVHTHLSMPGDGTPYHVFMQRSDGVLLMQAARNARAHLLSGVTTVADTGARGRVTFSLREAIDHGLLEGPRLVLCGRPITRTGGHCWFLGGEADGVQAISNVARQLLKEGADIIKMMATGGGTVGSYPYRPSLRTEELAAAINEAHAVGKKAIAHVSATEGIKRAIDARIDVIFHCHFYNADGTLAFVDGVARRIAGAGIEVNPTLYVNGVYLDLLEQKAERQGLEPHEQAQLKARTERYAGQRENVGRLVERGVKLVAGSDAGWGHYPFGDLVTELREMVRIGMPASEVVKAATSWAAGALGIGHVVGALASGMKADLLIVNGDPTHDIDALRNVDKIMLGGRVLAR
jgi:imidazolonepropionase-like amidohydrolase